MSYNIYKLIEERIQELIPDGYNVILLKEDYNDITCDYRRIRIYKMYSGQYIEFNITKDDLIDGKLKQYKIDPLIRKLDEDEMQYMFGRSKQEILKALDFYDNTFKPQITPAQEKNNKMTREKAFELAKDIGNNVPWYENTVRLLEALGLIKFEEENLVNVNGTTIPLNLYREHHLAINKLISAGFRFIKA